MLILPKPDQDGIQKAKAIIQDRTGREVSDEEAERLLGGTMKYLYLLRMLKEQVDEAKAKGEWPPADPQPKIEPPPPKPKPPLYLPID